jgi:anti-sigma B factor antagonist
MAVVSLQFRGKLQYGSQSERQYQRMCEALNQGSRTVVFDLSQASEINSEGIGFLVMCLATVERAGGQLRLAAPGAGVREALEVTKLGAIFPIFDTVEAALNAQPG